MSKELNQHPEQAEDAQGEREALPYWEPCNPGCDPEFNGERSLHCAQLCHNARAAMAPTIKDEDDYMPAGILEAAMHGERVDAIGMARAALAQPSPAPELIHCACGDAFPVNSYGAGFMDANNGVCENCDAANSVTRASELEKQVPVAHRLINAHGEVMTDWHDGPPPDNFTDLCGVAMAGTRVELAFAQAGQVPEWISVSERLPERDAHVLLATEFYRPGDWRIKVGALEKSGAWWIPGASWTPSHWMLLPTAPQPAKEDGSDE